MKTSLIILSFLILICDKGYSQIGVNTDNPLTTLDVRGTNDLGAVAATDGILVPRVNSLAVAGTENGQLVFLNTASGGDSIGFHYWSTAASDWLPIDTTVEPWNEANTTDPATSNSQNIYTSGLVGIGTDDPLGALHITTENSRDVLFFRFIDSATDDLDIDLFRTRGTLATPAINTDGTRLGGLRAQSITVPAAYTFRPAAEIYFQSDGDSGSTSSAGKIVLATTPTGTTGTVDRMVIREDGNVGINQPDPEATLDVNGSFKFTDTNQTNGAILTSDANGIATWTPPIDRVYGMAYVSTTYGNVTNGSALELTVSGPISNMTKTTNGLEIDTTGTYKINYSVSIQRDGGGTQEVDFYLRYNGVEIPGSRIYTDTDQYTDQMSNSNTIFYEVTTANATLEIVSLDTNTNVSILNGTSLTVEKVNN
ncbi:hypothetical protein [Nonlabens dokdonensis]|nr:hypothetical protein [Nonlabens dokdonensis]